MKAWYLILTLTSLLISLHCQATYQVTIEPQAGEAFARAEYTLWIPEGLDQIQRIILHQHGCGDAAQTAGQTATDDLHWRLLAQKTQSALLGSSLWPQGECPDWCDPDNGTERAFLQALDELAQLSSHPEVATVNWVIWGHSGGGYWTQSMLTKHPERFDAAIFQSAAFRLRENRDTALQSVPYSVDVPMLIHIGLEEKGHERFNALYEDGIATFSLMRKQNAPVTLMIDPASGHGTGNTRYLTIPWIAAVFNEKDNTGVTQECEHSERGNWFPNQIVAAQGEVFAAIGNVPDFTPPEQAPIDVRATTTDTGILLTWNATPDWESGIKTFRVYRDGELLPPYSTQWRTEGELTEFFRQPNYSDTPFPPLSNMEYTDASVLSGKSYHYQVSLVNWAGLESDKSRAVRIKVP
jgi:pimeloyl-ACP methyl ester carboxylesterase